MVLHGSSGSLAHLKLENLTSQNVLGTDASGNVVAGSVSGYSLPTATSLVLGGIKVGGTLTISSGILNARTYVGASEAGLGDLDGGSGASAGVAGYVPAASASQYLSFLRGDGTWQTPTNTVTRLRQSGGTLVAGDFTFAGSGATTVSYSGGTFTISSTDTDTNTTYSAGTGLTLTGTTFSVTTNTYAAAAHSHAIRDITDLQTALDGKQVAGSYAASSHTHDDRYLKLTETSSFFDRIIDAAPGTLDTLNELAAAIGDDTNFSASIARVIAGKAESGHTHSDATTSAAGFMSATDKTKLDGVASNANNYSLPTATSTVLGGIKVGSNLSISSGVLSATDTNTVTSVGISGDLSTGDIDFRGGGATTISKSGGTITISSTDTDTNTTYTAGTGLTLTGTTFSVTSGTYAAASHNHDDRYYTETEADARFVLNDFGAQTAATAEDEKSGTWYESSGDSSWGTYKPGDDSTAGYSYNDAPGYVQYNIPTGYTTAYIGQLRWSSGGYFDVHAVMSDGSLVFRGRYLSKNSIENESHSGNHDGQQIIKISGLDGMRSLRITNQSGRVHLQGIGWSKEADTANTQVSETHWDLVYDKPSSFTPSSHTHTIGNVTGLQTALDGKQASLGFTPYNATNPSGYITSYVDTVTSVGISGDLSTGNVEFRGSGATTISKSGGTITISSTDTNTTYSAGTGLTLTGTTFSVASGTYAASSHTHGIDSVTDAARWWNNFGDGHGTRTSFDVSAPSYGFGWRYIQGSTNGPGTGGSQFYSLYVGLGNDYPSTGAGSYGMYLAIDRNQTNPYLSVRFNENNGLSSWRRINAGYADSAGAVAWDNVSSKPSTFSPSTHTHTIGNVTGLQTALDGKQASGDYSVSGHTHSIRDVTDLQTTLDGKQASGNYAASSHTHTIGNVTGLQTALDGKLGTSGKAADSETIDGIDSSRIVYGEGVRKSTSLSTMNSATDNVSGFFFYNSPTGNPFGDWTHWISSIGNSWDNNYGFQIAHAFHSDGFAVRRVTNGSFGSWRTIIDSGNIGSQSVNYASSAGAVAWDNVSSKPTTFTPSSHTHTIGNVTGLQTALDGKQASGDYSVSGHTHAIRDITDLQTTLDGKLSTSGTAAAATNVAYSGLTGTVPTWNQDTTGNASKLNPLSGDSNYKLAYTANGARNNAGEWGRAVMFYVPNSQTYGIRVDRADLADTATNSNYINSTRDTPGSALQYWQAPGLGLDEAPSGDWHNTIRMGHGSPLSYYSNTLAIRMTGTGVGDIYTQTIMNGTRQGWKKHWNDSNLTNLNQLTNGPGYITGISYDNVSDKPSTFTPSAHTHSIRDITDLQTTLDGKQASGNYAASSHTHDDRYYTETESDARFAAAGHGHTGLSSNDWGGLTSRTANGYIDFGPANTSHAHIYTDRPNFYFNKTLLVNGTEVAYAGHTHDDRYFTETESDARFLKLSGGTLTGQLVASGVSSGVSLHVGNGSTHGVYTAGDERKQLVVSADYYPHMALVATSANNTNHGAVFSFVGTEGTRARQWNIGIPNNDPFIFSIGYNATGDNNPHYGVGDAWSGNDAHHARLSIDRSGNTKIRGMLYVNGTSGGMTTGNAVIHAGNIGSQSVNYAASAGNADTVDGYHATNAAGGIAVINANGYWYPPSWINVGSAGIYSGTNNAHFRPNTSSYGSWEIIGSKNGWSGIFFSDSSNTLMANGDESGFYRIGDGWQFRWYRGEFYISPGGAGGGTERIALHAGNYSSYALPLSGGTVTGETSFTKSTYPVFIYSYGNTAAVSAQGLQVYSSGGNGAIMAFHRGGYYAVNMGLDSDNVIRIGGWSAAANRMQLDMSGNVTFAGNVTGYSDARIKTDVKTIDNALEKVKQLRGVSFTRTDSDDRSTNIGVIAQEVLEIVPEVVSQDASGMYNVAYGNMAGLFVEAIKQQQTLIEQQQKQIDELKALVDGLTK